MKSIVKTHDKIMGVTVIIFYKKNQIKNSYLFFLFWFSKPSSESNNIKGGGDNYNDENLGFTN